MAFVLNILSQTIVEVKKVKEGGEENEWTA